MNQENREKLAGEVLRTRGIDLVERAHRGSVILAHNLDLIDVAAAIADDEVERVGAWLTSGEIERANAATFTGREQAWFQMVVVQPFVIAQHLPTQQPAEA